MIRTKKDKDGSGKVTLYSKDGSRVLGEWGFATELGKKRALTKAKNRENEINKIKYATA